jgi:hypothetical protein
MIRLVPPFGTPPAVQTALIDRLKGSGWSAILLGIAALLAAIPATAQITVNTHTGTVTNSSGTTLAATVDRRYTQIQPTHVALSKSEMDTKNRLEIIRIMQAEQGFAMRPFPRGHKGLVLNANGKLDPAGEGYLQMVTAEGICAKPGDRVVLTDIKIEHNRIVFQLNGGPDRKHRFLRHIEVGTGPMMGPVVQGDDPDPVGARLTLAFHDRVPELTGADVKALLAPMISFDVKTPVQAFTDTLPKVLKDAILNHHVMVGMSTDMVLFAMGQPDNKSREIEGQTPFEEWIYGKPPHDVQFVRINGNRVIRLEICKVGQDPVVFTKDEVEGLMRTDGTPLEQPNTKTVAMGDTHPNPDTQAPTAPPTLRAPGEKLPADDDKDTQNGRVGVMRPVQFPKSTGDDSASGDSSQQPPAAPAPANQPAGGANPSGNAQPSGSTPPSGSSGGSSQTNPATDAPPASAQTPPAGASQSGSAAKPQTQTQNQQN